MQKTKGVSLIVLVITIIVMTILAGAIIITLSNSGVIDKATQAVTDTNIATVKEIANMAWAEAYLENRESGKTELDAATVQAAINTAFEKNKITEEDYKGYTMEITDKGVEFISDEEVRYKALNPTGIIPEGATYTTGRVWVDSPDFYGWEETNLVTYTAGDSFPENVSNGDRYVYGDYEYGYNTSYNPSAPHWGGIGTTNGWAVGLVDRTKTTYGAVLNSINGKPITVMQTTFGNCSALKTLSLDFMVPNTVVDMRATFSSCSALESLPEGFNIPSGVKDIAEVFGYCTSLVATIAIDANISSGMNYRECFEGVKDVTLVGESTMLQKYADANMSGKITVGVQ